MRSLRILGLIFSVFLFSALSATATEREIKKTELKTVKDKISYVLGTRIGVSIKRDKLEPDYDVLIGAIKDTLNNQPPLFTGNETQQIIQDYEDYKRKEEAIKTLGDNAWKVQLEKPAMMEFDKNKNYFWILETSKGTIKCQLRPSIAPMHVTSTIYLTQKGFYDGLSFHRIEPGFVIQGGCPLGNGKGNPGYTYDGEFSRMVKHDRPFLLSTANRGIPNTDGSQFFITLKSAPHLDNRHTIFGKVVDGFDVVQELEKAGTRSGNPKEPVFINKATIEIKEK